MNNINSLLRTGLAATLLFLILSFSGTGQGLRVSAGTMVTESGGTMILDGDLINFGSFVSMNSTVVFSGGTQTVGGSTPAAFDNIIVDDGSTVTLVTPGQVQSGILLCNGILNSDGNLTLLSSDSFTALIDGAGTGQVNGIVTMQRYLQSGFGYKYFSSPFQAALVSEFSDNMKLADPFPAFYSYDESRTTSGWVTYVDPAGLLSPMQGYAINFGDAATPMVFDVSGEVTNGPVSTTLYNHNNTYSQGFNLTGNPYPSPIDWDAPSGWTKINIDNGLYFFEASTSDQYGGSYVTYLGGVSSNGLATNLIPSMQGFFIHVSNGAYPVSATLGMTNLVRVNDLTHPLIKSEPEARQLIRLSAEYSGDTLSRDPTVIYFDDKATPDFDSQKDALKLMNTDFYVTNFYSLGGDGRPLSINGLPPLTDSLFIVPLGLQLNMDGNIIFRVRALEGELGSMTLCFSDTVAKIKKDLVPDMTYTVELTEGKHNNRFFIEIRNKQTGIDDETAEDPMFKIYSAHGIINLKITRLAGSEGTLTLTALTGQPLLIEKFYEPGNYELNPGLKNGIYIATFISGGKTESEKLFVQGR